MALFDNLLENLRNAISRRGQYSQPSRGNRPMYAGGLNNIGNRLLGIQGPNNNPMNDIGNRILPLGQMWRQQQLGLHPPVVQANGPPMAWNGQQGGPVSPIAPMLQQMYAPPRTVPRQGVKPMYAMRPNPRGRNKTVYS